MDNGDGAGCRRLPREYGDPPSLHELWRTGRRVVRSRYRELIFFAGRGVAAVVKCVWLFDICFRRKLVADTTEICRRRQRRLVRLGFRQAQDDRQRENSIVDPAYDTRAGSRRYAGFGTGRTARLGGLSVKSVFFKTEPKKKMHMCLGMNALGKNRFGFVRRSEPKFKGGKVLEEPKTTRNEVFWHGAKPSCAIRCLSYAREVVTLCQYSASLWLALSPE